MTSREISLYLDLDYDDVSGATSGTNLRLTDVRSGQGFTVAFTLDGYIYTFNGVKFPKLPYAAGGDDLFGDKVESNAVTGMTIVAVT